jgi:hypothetical protein
MDLKKKDVWIQKAKALLFDCISCVDAPGIVQEIDQLLDQAGGYDPKTETADSELALVAPQRLPRCLILRHSKNSYPSKSKKTTNCQRTGY